MQSVLVLTDHKSLESWTKEVLDTPSGPLGRRSRWHQIFSKFDLSVGYIPGKQNLIQDILSRWAYPASQAYRDISKHGTQEDKEEMLQMLEDERREEMECMWLKLRNPPTPTNLWLKGVTTRGGTSTDPEKDKCTRPEVKRDTGSAGTDTQDQASSSTSKGKKKVKFQLPPPQEYDSDDEEIEELFPDESTGAEELGDASAIFSHPQKYPADLWSSNWNKK